MQKIIGIFVLGLALLHISAAAPAYGQQPSPETMRQFSQLARAQPPNAPAQLIAALQDFVAEHPDFAHAYHQLAEQLLYHFGSDSALSHFQKLDNGSTARNSSWVLANLYGRAENPDLAMQHFRIALQKAPADFFIIDDFIAFDHGQQDQFNALDELALLQIPAWQFDFARALHLRRHLNFKQARALLQSQLAHPEWRPYRFNMLGLIAFYQRDYEAAGQFWREGLALAHSEGDMPYRVNFLTNLGILQARRGQFGASDSTHKHAVALADSLHDLGRRAFARANHGSLYYQQKKYAESLQHFRIALDISMRLGNPDHITAHARGMATAARQLDDFDLTLQSIQQAETFAERAGNRVLQFEILLLKGNLFNQMNLPQLARADFEKVVQLAEQTPFEKMSQQARGRLAEFYLENRQFEHARSVYRTLLAGDAGESQKIYWQWVIGDSYFQEGKFAQAEQAYHIGCERAAQNPNSSYAGYAAASMRKQIGDCYFEMGKIDSALIFYREEQVAQLAESRINFRFDLNFALGQAYRKLGDAARALEHFNAAAETAEASRAELSIEDFRIGAFSGYSKVYRELAQLALETYEAAPDSAHFERLFFCVEQSRARTTKDALYQPHLPDRDNGASDAYRQAKAELSRLQRHLRAHPLQADSLREQLEMARYNLISKRLQVAKADSTARETRQLNFAEIADRLRQLDASLLLYHIAEDASFALVADGEQHTVVRVPISPDSLSRDIQNLLQPFHTFDPQAVSAIPFRAALAHRLYQGLMAPIEQAVELKQRLLIVPDLPLMGLPFEMLLDSAATRDAYLPTDSPDYASHFLAQRYAIRYSPSTALLMRTRPASRRPREVAVFANPFQLDTQAAPQLTTRSGWRFDFLWFAEKEATGVQNIWPQTTIFAGGSAHADNLQTAAGNYDILHFATHAFADTVFDAFSGLVLAQNAQPRQNEADDGLLMGYEIAEQVFDCELVTLSACESGRGPAVAGEGVLGLPRLFFASGARQVLMTLWKVDDRFAAELMPVFYDHFLNDGQETAIALQQAKSKFFAAPKTEAGIYYQHPFYWAAFTLYGAPPSATAGSGRSDGQIAVPGILLAGLVLVVLYLRRHFLKRDDR